VSAELLRSVNEVRAAVTAARQAGRTIGCVPTMGALHAGHGSLIHRSAEAGDFIVVTIFVNPIQFDRREDYDAYAISLPADAEFCGRHGAGAVFAPPVEEMYPEGFATTVEVAALAQNLCGAFRPGHFRGVATVVAKLLNVVQPDTAYFGEKDAQQLAIIRQMTADLNLPVRIVGVPTVREDDGLALSSRNRRLNEEERRMAPLLFRALEAGRQKIAEGERDPAIVRRTALAMLKHQPAWRVEYIEVVDARRMQAVDTIREDVRIAAAAWLGSTRLIDNVLCRVT
jgi:pantoate--beta-alanine ligase